jgi:hypothetical protein
MIIHSDDLFICLLFLALEENEEASRFPLLKGYFGISIVSTSPESDELVDTIYKALRAV